MRIVTYNLRAGGANKTHWHKIISEYDPDLFLVQETFNPIEHLPSTLYGERYLNTCWTPVDGRKWGSAVYAKHDLVRLELDDFHGHVIGVEVQDSASRIDGRSLRVFSIHAPARGGYPRAVGSILDLIEANRGEGDVVIGGDFNLTVGQRLEAETLPNNDNELAIITRLRDRLDLVSAWQYANVGVPLAQTLRWSNNRELPFHCDGIFIPQTWVSRLRSSAVVSGPEWAILSDHNPVVVDIM